MAKKSTAQEDADVSFNKFSMAAAKLERLMATFVPADASEDSANSETKQQLEREEKEIPSERIGIGYEDVEEAVDKLLKRRELSSNDRLREQLLGKKAAQAHIAARQASRNSQLPNKTISKPTTTKQEESEEEEEGRTAAFSSKKQKKTKKISAPSDQSTHQEEVSAFPDTTVEVQKRIESKRPQTSDSDEDDDKASISRVRKPKSGNYLDEVLAERSKKKRKKQKKSS